MGGPNSVVPRGPERFRRRKVLPSLAEDLVRQVVAVQIREREQALGVDRPREPDLGARRALLLGGVGVESGVEVAAGVGGL